MGIFVRAICANRTVTTSFKLTLSSNIIRLLLITCPSLLNRATHITPLTPTECSHNSLDPCLPTNMDQQAAFTTNAHPRVCKAITPLDRTPLVECPLAEAPGLKSPGCCRNCLQEGNRWVRLSNIQSTGAQAG